VMGKRIVLLWCASNFHKKFPQIKNSRHGRELELWGKRCSGKARWLGQGNAAPTRHRW
jgi:hypothetical protein